MTEVSIPIYALELKTRKAFPVSAQNIFPKRTVLCLGNFDGVHRGHAALIKKAVNEAKLSEGAVSGAWFFSRPTREYLEKSSILEITLIDEKLDIMQDFGIEYAFVADFGSFRDMSAKDFISVMLEKICNCETIVCGYNFRFGKMGLGNPSMLSEQFSGKTHIISCVKDGQIPISSSLIRKLLEEGDVEHANILLGHPFSLSSPVVHGKEFGRTIGFPTANQIFPEGKILPRCGVYASKVYIEGFTESYIGVSNIGSNPTVNDKGNITCETFILDFDKDIYEKNIKVEFYTMLRQEKKFGGIDDLRTAISQNASEAREYLCNKK